MKKLIAVLLSVVMLVSMLPISAIALDHTAEPVEPVEVINESAENDLLVAQANTMLAMPAEPTVDEVRDALNTAEQSEKDAAGVITSPIYQTETAAAEAEHGALDKLEGSVFGDAMMDYVMDTSAGFAEENQEQAKADADKAEEAAEKAAEAADTADAAAQDAKEATSYEDAQKSANEAKLAATGAELTAAQAAVYARQAQEAADAAAKNYETAKEAYETLGSAVAERLAQGLIDAEEAERLTKEAAEKAEATYQEMLAAQEAAEKAYEAAKAYAEEANQNLQDAATELDRAIVENAQNVQDKTTAVVATTVALAAAKVAVEVAQQTVNYCEMDVEELEGQVADLKEKIAEVDEKIAAAQAEIDALNEEDAEYPQAVAALEAAEKAKAEAETVMEQAQAVLDAHEAAEQDGGAATMAYLQEKVSSGEASVAEKQALTEYVLENIGANGGESFGEVKFVTDDVFTVTDKDGNVSYYTMKTVEDENGNNILQYYKTEKSDFTVVTELPAPESLYTVTGNIGIGDDGVNTKYKGVDANGVEYEIYVVRQGLFLTGYSYNYRAYNKATKDLDIVTIMGDFYVFDAAAKQYVKLTIKDPTTPSYAAEKNPVGTDSDAIKDKWAEADEDLANYEAALAAVEEAQQNYEQAKEAYDNAKAPLEEKIAELEAEKAQYEEQLAVAQENLDEARRKLEGDLGDQLVRAVVEGDTKAIASAAAKVLKITLFDIPSLQREINKDKKAGRDTTEKEARLEKLRDEVNSVNNAIETGKQIADILDEGITIEDAPKMIELLTDPDMSAETKLAIAKRAESLLEDMHTKAVEELKQAIAQAEEELKNAREGISDAAEEAIKASLAQTTALASKLFVEGLTKNAETTKLAADQAAADAKAARELYEKLANSYGADDSRVQAAKQAADQAQEEADRAAREAEEAEKAAEEARKSADEAQQAADALRPGVTISIGMRIALYAMSLKGTRYAELVGHDSAKMTSSEFVKFVFAHFGYSIDYGTTISNEERDAGDMIAVDGSKHGVQGLAICYDKDVYIYFNEKTGEVEIDSFVDATSYTVARIAA